MDNPENVPEVILVCVELLLKQTAMLSATANTILVQNAHILALLGNAAPDQLIKHWFELRDQDAEARLVSLKDDLSKALRSQYPSVG